MITRHTHNELERGSEKVVPKIQAQPLSSGTPRQNAIPSSESTELYRAVLDSMDQGFCIIELMFDERDVPIDYRFLEVNPAFEKQTGLKAVTGKRMRELTPHHEQNWFELYGKVALTGEPVRFVNQAIQLNRWFNVNAFRVGQPEERKVAIIFDDISERIRSAERLQHTEAQRFALIDKSPIGMYLVDSEFRLSQVNAKAKPILLGGDELIGRDFNEIIRAMWPPERSEEILAHFRHTLETGEPYYAPGFVEGRVDIQQTEYYDWEIHRVALPDGRYGVVCYFIDISEHVWAQRRILEREALLRTVTNEARVGLVMISPDRRYLYANSAYAKILQLSESEIVGRRVSDVLGSLYERISPRLDKAFAGERGNYELRYPHDKEERVYEVIYEPQADAP